MHRRIIILVLLLLSIGSIVVSFEPQHVETVPTSRTEAILTQNGEKDPDESPKVPQEYRQEVFDAILVQTPSGPVPISRLVQVKSRTVPIDQQYELHPDVLLLTDGSEHFKAFNQIWYGIKQLFRFSTMKSLLWSTWNGATGLLKFSTWKSIIWSSWDLFKRSPSLFWNTSRGLIGGLWSLQGLKTVLLWSMWSPILGSIAALMLGLSFTTLFGTLLGAGFLYWFFHAPRAKTFEGRKVPLPPGYRFNWGRWKLPIFGDTFDFLRSPFVFTDTMAKRFGNVSYSNLWFSNTILLSGKSGMRSFYNQELVGRGSSFPSHFSSTSLGRKVEDRKLDAQRSILVKAVANQTRLDNFTTDIESTIDRYIFNWSSKKHFKFSDELQLLGAELTSKFLLGVTDKDMNRKISNYNNSILLGNESLPMPVPYLFNFGNGLLASRRVRQLYTEIIDHHLAGKTEYPNKYPYIRRGSAMDVIASELKKSNLIVTKKDVVWELYHMFLASHQLIGNAMTDMMICFSRYPDIFNKARREVFNNLQPTDRLSVDKLQNLPYIDAIVDEVRRCFAFVPYQSGYAKKDFEVDGFLVPKGYKVMGCFYATNHDYNLWSQPYTFRPERFGNGEPRSNEKYPFTFNNQSWAWVPHGAANHMCPGTDLTTYILKIAAIEIIRKGCSWDVPSQDLKSKLPLYNPRPENGFQIRNFRSQQLSTA